MDDDGFTCSQTGYKLDSRPDFACVDLKLDWPETIRN